MTPIDQKNRNDVVEFATLLYGASWRDQLARKLGTTRGNLDHWMAAPSPLPNSIMLGLANQMKIHLDAQRRELEETDLRVTKLRRQIATPIRRAGAQGPKAGSTEKVPTYRAQLHVVDQPAINA